jgi:hypothetical protein
MDRGRRGGIRTAVRPPHLRRIHALHQLLPLHRQAADALNLEALLEHLSDFLLQSGFAGGPTSTRSGASSATTRTARSTRSSDALLRALIESGQLTPEMLEELRGEGAGDEEVRARSPSCSTGWSSGWSRRGTSTSPAPPRPGGHIPLSERRAVDEARSAARQVEFNLTEGRRLPRVPDAAPAAGRDGALLLRLARDAAPGHRRGGGGRQPAVRVRRHAQPRHPAHARARSRARGCATTARSPRLRRPARAPGGVPLELRDGAAARHQPLHDPLRRGPLHAREEGRARAHAPDPHAVPRRHAAGGALRRPRRGDPALPARARAGRPLPHQHGRGAQGGAAAPARAEQGDAADRDDHRRQALGAHPPRRPRLQEPDGARPRVLRETFAEVAACRKAGILINTFMLARDPAWSPSSTACRDRPAARRTSPAR